MIVWQLLLQKMKYETNDYEFMVIVEKKWWTLWWCIEIRMTWKKDFMYNTGIYKKEWFKTSEIALSEAGEFLKKNFCLVWYTEIKECWV